MEYATVYRQKELCGRRDPNLLGSSFKVGVETARVKDSGKVDMSSQVQLGLAVTVQDRSSSVETVLKAQVMALEMSVDVHVVR